MLHDATMFFFFYHKFPNRYLGPSGIVFGRGFRLVDATRRGHFRGHITIFFLSLIIGRGKTSPEQTGLFIIYEMKRLLLIAISLFCVNSLTLSRRGWIFNTFHQLLNRLKLSRFFIFSLIWFYANTTTIVLAHLKIFENVIRSCT